MYSILILLMVCYLAVAWGAFMFWLAGLALVAEKILLPSALPWCAGFGAVLGLLLGFLAWASQLLDNAIQQRGRKI